MKRTVLATDGVALDAAANKLVRTEDQARALRDALADWSHVRTAKDLKDTILRVSTLLRQQGDHARADDFAMRLQRAPKRMNKESINFVLFAVCIELGLVTSRIGEQRAPQRG